MASTAEKFDTNLLPPEGNPKLGVKIFELLDEILQHKLDMGLPDKWNRAHELTRNRHWKVNKTKKASLVTANLLHTHRQRTISHLTDNNPTFNVSRAGMSDDNEDAYETILHLAEYWWSNTEQQHKFEMTVSDGEQNGCTIEKIRFNPEAEYGIGEVETEIISPYYVGYYPVNGGVDIQKKEAVLHFYPMPLREARRRWPDFADKIKADREVLERIGDNRQEIIQGGRKADGNILTTFASVVRKLVDSGGIVDSESDEVLIVECWAKDYTSVTEESEIQQEDGTVVIEQVTRPKYRGLIRCVTSCNAGELVLDDRSNPSINPNIPDDQAIDTYLYDKFPFVHAQSITDTSSIWGMSDYEQLEQLCMEVSKSLTQITMIKDKSARLKIINPKDTGVDNQEFTNAPGVIRPATSMVSQAIRYMDPPRLDPNLWKAVDLFKDIFFLVAGSFDLEQASSPGSEVIAYKAIAALLEQVATRLRSKLRNYSKLIRERGRMAISLMQHWYTEERWFVYEDDGEEVAEQAVGADLILPAKLTVVSGSTMPRSRVQEREEALALFGMQAIDQVALLKAIDFPDYKKIVKRMQAGPLMMFLERLAAVGTPEELLQYMQQIAQLDDKEFEKAAEKGEIPPPPVAANGGVGPSPADAPSQIESAEMQVKAAEAQAKVVVAQETARKVQMETRLTAEKIVSEIVDQQVKIKGVEFDEEKLAQMRAKLMADLEQQEFSQWQGVAQVKTQAEMAKQGDVYRERGMMSNNKR